VKANYAAASVVSMDVTINNNNNSNKDNDNYNETTTTTEGHSVERIPPPGPNSSLYLLSNKRWVKPTQCCAV